MSNKNTEKTLRDRYFSNDIFKIGDLVEDITTGEQMKILDRGSNYVTVATNEGILKKWLNQITEDITPKTEIVDIVLEKVSDSNFIILESGQIQIFGYITKNFNIELSEFVIEQFTEFTDLYSKHQIIKCLDMALSESDADRAYTLLDKVEKFYATQCMESPLIVEVLKNDTERTRIAEIIATVAGVPVSASNNNKTITDSIKALKEKYQTRKQWEVLMPFLKMARDTGLIGATQNLPYSMLSLAPSMAQEEFSKEEIIFDVLAENIDLVVDDLEYQDLEETFVGDEFVDDLISEVLSIEDRNKLAVKLKQHEPILDVKRQRALSRGASTAVLMQRARRLAEVMMKRRMFHKPVGELSRQEKERFESGAGGRKAAIAKLAQRLVSKVRMLQTTRMHHTSTPVSHTHDKATANYGGTNTGAT